MGASIALAANNSQKGWKYFHDKSDVTQNPFGETVVSSPPDYKFEHFMKLCQDIQKQKKTIELHLRQEIEIWRSKARRGEDTGDCRLKVGELLTRFRNAQETQDILIERERLRLSTLKNVINEETSRKMKDRLHFFAALNKEHEMLLEMVRQDVQDCRMICKRFPDPHLRFRTKT